MSEQDILQKQKKELQDKIIPTMKLVLETLETNIHTDERLLFDQNMHDISNWFKRHYYNTSQTEKTRRTLRTLKNSKEKYAARLQKIDQTITQIETTTPVKQNTNNDNKQQSKPNKKRKTTTHHKRDDTDVSSLLSSGIHPVDSLEHEELPAPPASPLNFA